MRSIKGSLYTMSGVVKTSTAIEYLRKLRFARRILTGRVYVNNLLETLMIR